MKQLFFLIFCLSLNLVYPQQAVLPPDKIYGQLFVDVQLGQVFPDSKTFVDCIPLRSPDRIISDYLQARKDSGTAFSLRHFIYQNFRLPAPASEPPPLITSLSVENRIRELWKTLSHRSDTPISGSSLLPLPYPYIVPGGRFREIYYWDSYFTMLGLEASGEWDMIRHMTDNFSYLIRTYRHIPNGNRSYYLSRSQPPFFSLMVGLVAQHWGDSIYVHYLPALEKEYDYWMDQTPGTRHVIQMPDGSLLNRYYDRDSIPRQESYREDYLLAKTESAKALPNDSIKAFSMLCRNLRSGAESGWDFSSRWFADQHNLNTIHVIDLLPVDLNVLLYHLETTLARAYRQTQNPAASALFLTRAARRKTAINKYCWNAKAGWYADYDFIHKKQSDALTLAGITPLFFKLASPAQATKVQKTLVASFLKAGGVVTTLQHSGQQWDGPNGWAPLQWLAIKGLENYGFGATARETAVRWIRLNTSVYTRTGKLMEKYNVEDISLEAGGGEYPGQDGFGWTNGVLLKLISLYGNGNGK